MTAKVFSTKGLRLLIIIALITSLLPVSLFSQISAAWAKELQAAQIDTLGQQYATESIEEDDGQTNIYGLFYEDGTFVIQKGSEPNYAEEPEEVISLDERLQATVINDDRSILHDLGDKALRVKQLIISTRIQANNMEYFFGENVNGKNMSRNLSWIENLHYLDTSKATSMSGMFWGCRSLETLDLSAFETSLVTNMSSMFRGCNSLQVLDLSSFDTSAVTDMNCMFDGCEQISFIELSSFDTSNVVNMSNMFVSCIKLQFLDLTSFHTPSVKGLGRMFMGCESLQALDLSSFTTSQAFASDIFANCYSLTEIKVGPQTFFHVAPNYITQSSWLPFGSYAQWTNEQGEIFTREDIPRGRTETFTAVNAEGLQWAYHPSFASCIYDGKAHGSLQDGNRCTVRGAESATEIGTYEVEVNPDNGAAWAPYSSTDSKKLSWSILPAFAKFDASNQEIRIPLTKELINIPLSYTGDGRISYSASNPSIAQVSISNDSLIIEPIAPGTTSIFLKAAAGKNYSAASKQIVITIFDPDQLIPTTPPSANTGLTYTGSTQIGVTSTPEVSVVNGSGRDAGNYKAIATPKEGCCWPNGNTDPIEIPWSIAKAKPILNATSSIQVNLQSSISKHPVTYSGDGKLYAISNNPEVAIASYQNGLLFVSPTGLGSTTISLQAAAGMNYLAENRTITVTVSNNSADIPSLGGSDSPDPPVEEPGSAITLTPIAIGQATIATKTYTGKTLKPTSVAVTVGGKKLRNGVDYTFSCAGGKKVGNYAVTIQGKGSYGGTLKATFQILPKGVSLSKIKGSKKAFSASWKKPNKKVLTQMSGYQIRYSTSSKFTTKATKTKTISGTKKTSYSIKKLKSGKKYYVQLRTYKKIGGKTLYSSWSKSRTVKAK